SCLSLRSAQRAHGVWCNRQHSGFWYRRSRFESWYPSDFPSTEFQPASSNGSAAPSYRGLVRRPLTAVARVRIPLGSHSNRHALETVYVDFSLIATVLRLEQAGRDYVDLPEGLRWWSWRSATLVTPMSPRLMSSSALK